jgi:hypothetical protein
MSQPFIIQFANQPTNQPTNKQSRHASQIDMKTTPTYLSPAALSFPPNNPPPLAIPKTEGTEDTTPKVGCSAVATKVVRSKIAKFNKVLMPF